MGSIDTFAVLNDKIGGDFQSKIIGWLKFHLSQSEDRYINPVSRPERVYS